MLSSKATRLQLGTSFFVRVLGFIQLKKYDDDVLLKWR